MLFFMFVRAPSRRDFSLTLFDARLHIGLPSPRSRDFSMTPPKGSLAIRESLFQEKEEVLMQGFQDALRLLRQAPVRDFLGGSHAVIVHDCGNVR